MKRRKGDLSGGGFLPKHGKTLCSLKCLEDVWTETIEDAAIPLRKFFSPSVICERESCLSIDR